MPDVTLDVRSLEGVDLLSLDGRLAVRCSNTTLPYKEVKRFIRVARWIYKAANFNGPTGSCRVNSHDMFTVLRVETVCHCYSHHLMLYNKHSIIRT